MHWYAILSDTKNLRMRDYLDTIRGSVLSMDDEVDNPDTGFFFYNLASIIIFFNLPLQIS
jgi:hypothetical protein